MKYIFLALIAMISVSGCSSKKAKLSPQEYQRAQTQNDSAMNRLDKE